jgi:hypothetical protein
MSLSEALDTTAEPTDESGSAEGAETSEASEASFHWADGVAGEGDVPEWFKADKYKSVAEQARAYTGLELKLGRAAELIGAPEQTEETEATAGYDIAQFVPEGADVELDAEDPFFKALLPEMREMGLSQAAASRLAQKFVAAQLEQGQEAQQSLAAGIEALGGPDRVRARVESIMGFAKGSLSSEQYEGLRSMLDSGFSAEGFEALEMIVQRARGTSPAGPETAAAPTVTMDQVRKMQFEEKDGNGNLRFNTDPEFRKRVRNLRRQVVGDGDYQEVVGR